MKVLWIGHYREKGGWANAAINSILALDSVGVEVVPVNDSLTGANESVPDRILELERGNRDDCDICVQNILPHRTVSTDRFKKNIAYVVTEGVTIRHTTWASQLNLMDAVWVPNSTNQESMSADLDVECYTVPYAFNLDQYDSVYDKMDLGEANDKFKFYYVGELNARKNLETLLKCWHSAFWSTQDVALVLKINKFGHDEKQLLDLISGLTSHVKKSLRIFPNTSDYHNEVVITNYLNRDDLLKLHNTCDCFITASHGEGWSLPAFDAMCLGNAPICVNEGGPKDFIEKQPECGNLVSFTYGPCVHTDAAFPFVNTATDMWANIDERDFMLKMMKSYQTWKSGKWNKGINRKFGLDSAEDYSYQTVGEVMKGLLHE